MSAALTVRIGARAIGAGHPPYVIAELGVNHNGDPKLAEALVDAAAGAGADTVKLQTFRSEGLALPEAAQATYQRERAAAASQLEMLRSLELPDDRIGPLRERALSRGMELLSSPFDLQSLEVVAAAGVPAIKIGSGDLTNLLLLRAAAATGLPLIVSTGMATLDEIDVAVADLQRHGDPAVVLLHCVSVYPAAPHLVNLRAMATMAERYGVPIGFSDHTEGIGVAVAAVALGATIVEKHLTLDRSMPGPDHAASLEPSQFGAMVAAIREAHAGLGSGEKGPRREEDEVRAVARRSLVTARAVPAGQQLAAEDLTALRPESGVSPMLVDSVIGRRATADLEAGRLLRPTDLAPPLEVALDRDADT
jgi:N,N'-diacetyllegionaminate synthase